MSDLETKVLKEIKFCIKSLSNAIDYKVKDFPKVKLSKNNKSYYNFDDKNIYLTKKDIENGTAYYEESAHFLRHMLVSEMIKKSNHKVHEFFGRLGEGIGRKLTKNTEYKYLFDGKKGRNFSDLNFFEKKIEEVIDSETLKDKHKLRNNKILLNSANVGKIINNCTIELGKVIMNYDDEKDDEKLLNDVTGVFENYTKNLKELKGKIYKEIIEYNYNFFYNLKNLYKNVLKLIEGKNNLNGNWAEEERKSIEERCRDNYFYIQKNYERISKASELCYNFLNLVKTKSDIINFKHGFANYDFYNHLLGYVAAEQFMRKNSDFMEVAPELFRKSEEEVYNNFFDDKALKPYYNKLIKVVINKFGSRKEKKLIKKFSL